VVTRKLSEPNTTFSDLNLLAMNVLQKMFSYWPDSLGEQFRKEFSLTEKDMKELDEFAMLANDVPIASVIEMIGVVAGPEYTSEMKFDDLNLKQLRIFNVASLRANIAEDIELIPLPRTIISFLKRVRL